MKNSIVDEVRASKELARILEEVCGIQASDIQKSLFGEPYRLTAENCVYVLFELSRVLCFNIEIDLVNEMNDFSFSDIVKAISGLPLNANDEN